MPEQEPHPVDRTALQARTVTRARNLRQQATFHERVLWGRLRKRPGGLKFRRQHPLDNFVADFLCHEARLIVELDGASHQGKAEYDIQRQQWMESQGFIVLRFGVYEVQNNLDGVMRKIVDVGLHRMGSPPSPDSA